MKTISRYLMTLVALFAMTTGALADEATITLKCGTTEKTYENVTLPWSTTAEILKAVVTDINFNININAISGGDGKVVKYGNENFTVTGTFSGEATVTVTYNMGSSATITVTAPGPLMTLNDTKTVATMESMPTYDVTVDYELVRDMSVSMTTKIGDGTDGYRIRLKKSEQNPGKYEPAEMTVQQLIALVKVHDAIEDYDLTFGVLGANCIVNIYAANDEDQATGDAIAFPDLTPGRYIAKAVAATGSAYEGETAMSNIFVLYEGYEVVIPAGEYATFYKDEAVRVNEADKENFKLYTVSSVSGDKATLSDAVDAMPKNTPMLVYNSTNETKTVLLIPCDEPDLAITVADQFLGTLTDKTFTDADMAAADYYVCNGKQFVKVRGAGTLGANKAYLQFVTNQQQSAPQYISISGDLGEGTTRIDNLNVNDNENGEWYDLNGRKLNGKPAQKGIYIKNGKKVVVR